MNTTKLIRAPRASEEPTLGDEVSELLPWVAGFVVLAPIALVSLMLWAPFLILAALALAVAVVAGVIALAGAVLATPYLLLRHHQQQEAQSEPVS